MSCPKTDILDAAAFLRRLQCEDERTRLKCLAHASRLERAATLLETLLLLETAMRNINDLIPIVVADVTKLRADNLALTTENTDLKAQLASNQAATATPENLQALDVLEPAVPVISDAAVTPPEQK